MILIDAPMPKSCTHCKAWTSSFYGNCIYTGSHFSYQDALLKRQPDCPIVTVDTMSEEQKQFLTEAGFEL